MLLSIIERSCDDSHSPPYHTSYLYTLLRKMKKNHKVWENVKGKRKAREIKEWERAREIRMQRHAQIKICQVSKCAHQKTQKGKEREREIHL